MTMMMTMMFTLCSLGPCLTSKQFTPDIHILCCCGGKAFRKPVADPGAATPMRLQYAPNNFATVAPTSSAYALAEPAAQQQSLVALQPKRPARSSSGTGAIPLGTHQHHKLHHRMPALAMMVMMMTTMTMFQSVRTGQSRRSSVANLSSSCVPKNSAAWRQIWLLSKVL